MSREQTSTGQSLSQTQQLDWPQPKQFYLTLDLECDYGTATSENLYHAVDAVDELAELLESYEIPLTVFVQTEVLEEKPEAVETLRTCSTPVRFHPHSHTHGSREEVTIEWEIETSTNRYRDFFGREPIGYRFPNGNVRNEDYRLLAKHGYEFDASVFPSWRPNHFNNTSVPDVPQYNSAHDIFEIPFTVYSDRLRIPTALSYTQLFQGSFDWLLTSRPPDVVVFNIHMHDLVTPETLSELPFAYKVLYGYPSDGFELLDSILDKFISKEYSFRTLNNLHEVLREEHEAPRETTMVVGSGDS